MTLARFSIAFFIILTPITAYAENPAPTLVIPTIPDEPCIVSQGQESCTKFVGCFGDEGEFFHGQARGRDAGALTANRSDGVTCTGTWVTRNSFGAGQADFSCDDGENGRVIYYYQDDYTGTAIGQGKSDRKRPIQMWSGKHLAEFFSKKDSQGRPILKCGPNEALIS